MSSLRVAELDAAQALLELRTCARENTQDANDRDTEEAAKLILSCFMPFKQEVPHGVAATSVTEPDNPYVFSVTLITDVSAPVTGPSTSMPILKRCTPEFEQRKQTCSSTNQALYKNKVGPNRKGVKSSKPRGQIAPSTRVYVMNNRNTNDDMIPIGNGHAVIPARIYRHINWNSYTTATRKLLTAVFSRKVLATHCLTGKRSPAFPSKDAKEMLDAGIVHDIVQTVSERCGVPKSLVRTSITTKCADESKMFRTRQNNKLKRQTKSGTENIPPTSESD